MGVDPSFSAKADLIKAAPVKADIATSGSPLPLQAGAADATPVSYDELPGWQWDDHALLLSVFQAGCGMPPALRAGVPPPPGLMLACEAARRIDRPAIQARPFFETHFRPWKIVPRQGQGFITGYYEPEFPGSAARTDEFATPLYARPPDLVTRAAGVLWPGLDPALSAARMTPDGLEPYLEREAIERGALAGRGLEIIWLRDPVDRFVMQVQGSGRVRLADGTIRRLAYAGRNGHPYTSLGRILVEEHGISPADLTMDRLVARLKSDPAEARKLVARNKSFVFFRIADEIGSDSGPIGGAGVPLTALRSVAADRTIWPYGTPVVLSGHLPTTGGGTEVLAHSAIIQDTGSAILGPARIDLFFGSGAEAGHWAGLVRHPMTLYVLWPREAGTDAPPP